MFAGGAPPAPAPAEAGPRGAERRRGRRIVLLLEREDPLGDARFDPALRVHHRVGAEPLRSSSWPVGWFACVGRPRRTCAPPGRAGVDEIHDGSAHELARSQQRVVCGRGRNPTFSPSPRHGPSGFRTRSGPCSRRARPVLDVPVEVTGPDAIAGGRRCRARSKADDGPGGTAASAGDRRGTLGGVWLMELMP